MHRLAEPLQQGGDLERMITLHNELLKKVDICGQASANAGMVQAWVAHFVTPLKCMYDEYN